MKRSFRIMYLLVLVIFALSACKEEEQVVEVKISKIKANMVSEKLAVNSSFVIEFTEEVKISDDIMSYIQLKQGLEAVEYYIKEDIKSKMITIDPIEDLEYETDYTISILPEIKNLNGDKIKEGKSINYTTEDDNNPPDISNAVITESKEETPIGSGKILLGYEFSGIVDSEKGIDHYEYSIGTLPGKADLVEWQSIGNNTIGEKEVSGIEYGSMIYQNIRAVDDSRSKNVSETISSNGIFYREQNSEKEFNVMIYMAADNNLNGYSAGYYDSYGDFAKYDIEEIESANIESDNVNVIVYGDFATEESGYRDGIYYLKNNELLEIRPLDEPNTGDGDNLTSFINFVDTNFQAKRDILFFWGHGDGWIDDKYGAENNPKKAIANDYGNGGDSLDLWEVEKSIDDSKVDRFDIIVADSCLMGTVEVAYQLKNVSDYVSFSPELVPGSGSNYRAIIEYLDSNEEEINKKIVNEIVNLNAESYAVGGSQAFYYEDKYGEERLFLEPVVYSAVDSSQMDDLVSEINELVKLLKRSPNLLVGIAKELQFYNYQYTGGLEDYNQPSNYVDFGDLLKILKQKAVDTVDIEVLDSVIMKYNRTITAIRYQNGNIDQFDGYVENAIESKSTGMSIYLPFSESINYRSEYYRNASKFGENTSWSEVIKLIY